MDQVFVVGLDREGVLRRRATVRRVRLIGGWFSFGFALIGMMTPLSLLFLGVDGIWVITVVLIGGMLPLVLLTGRVLWKTAQLDRWYAATDLPPFAMRMSPAALELGCEGATAPVVLPWPAVPGFRLRRRYGQPVLELASRISAAAPGVSGLDQPAAAVALRGDRLLKPAGFYGVAVLDQPLEAIDAALRYFSAGRAGIKSEWKRQQFKARKR